MNSTIPNMASRKSADSHAAHLTPRISRRASHADKASIVKRITAPESARLARNICQAQLPE
jgi:hypothetical protein